MVTSHADTALEVSPEDRFHLINKISMYGKLTLCLISGQTKNENLIGLCDLTVST